MEMILDLVTRYPELTQYIFGFILLLVVTSLVCLYSRKAKKRWTKVLETTISLCDSTLSKLAKPTLYELNVVEALQEAIGLWRSDKSAGLRGSDILKAYFNEGMGPLMYVERAYFLAHRLEEKGDVDNLFQLTASSLWRYQWLHSKANLLAALYMDTARLFSYLSRGSIIGVYSFVINVTRRKNNAAFKQLKKRGFLPTLQRLRPKKDRGKVQKVSG